MWCSLYDFSSLWVSFQDCPLAPYMWCSYRTADFPCKFSTQCFPGPLFTSLPLLGFAGKHSCCTSPFHYVILRVSLTQLLHLYFLLLLGLIGFWANPLSLLTHFLGFLGPFSPSLPLIILMGLLLHSLGFLGLLTSSLPLFILVGLASCQSCHSDLLGMLY